MWRTILAATVAMLALGAAAKAQEPRPADSFPQDRWSDGTWRFQITPYAWMPAMSAGIAPFPGGPELGIDRSIADIVDDLDGAFFLNGTARYNRFVLLGDFTWANLSESDTISGVLPVPIGIDASVDLTSGTAAAGYTIVAEPGLAVDLLGGVRLWDVEARVGVPLVPIALSVRETWADPVVGLRARADLSPAWSLIVYGDVGGFGAGSDLTWQIVGTFNYQVTENLFLSAGYRHMALDYQIGGAKLDVDLTGPLIGATIRF